jgi:hypothetical protein
VSFDANSGTHVQTFRDEIWADRYLGGQRRLGEGIVEIMRQDRYKAMQHPDPMDWCEQQISAYARQNFQWAGTWKLEVVCDGLRRPAFSHVEEHMAHLRGGRVGVDEHVAWLDRQGEIPFRDVTSVAWAPSGRPALKPMTSGSRIALPPPWRLGATVAAGSCLRCRTCRR